jgi:hypothetical protein
MCNLPKCHHVEVIELEKGNILYLHYNEDCIVIWMEMIIMLEDDKMQAYRYLPMSIGDIEPIPPPRE